MNRTRSIAVAIVMSVLHNSQTRGRVSSPLAIRASLINRVDAPRSE